MTSVTSDTFARFEALLNGNELDLALQTAIAAGMVRTEFEGCLQDPKLLPLPTQLGRTEALALFDLMRKAEHHRVAVEICEELWKSSNTAAKESLCSGFIDSLFRSGQSTRAGEIFRELLKLDVPVLDYRPRWDDSSLCTHRPSHASALFAEDKLRYEQARRAHNRVTMWRPIFMDTGAVQFRGASLKAEGIEAEFHYGPRAAGNATPRLFRLVANIEDQSDDVVLWSAEVADLLPDQEYEVRLSLTFSADRVVSESRKFTLPALGADPVVTGVPEEVGMGGAVFSGVLCPIGTGSRYRFEYGADPNNLTNATPWYPVPPPRQAHNDELAYRHFGNWIPRSTDLAWRATAARELNGANQRAMRLIAPFAKDRNQLSGIGSHEMPINFSWCSRWEVGRGPIPKEERQTSLSVAGGVMDLRDAEFTFTIRGDVDQKGSVLTFWPLRAGEDSRGKFGSQWATTGAPFPDESLEDGSWHKVTITLTNDPRLWTYTGNNPVEQGERAMRYRKLPLDQTLAGSDGAFVLIFACGDERDPPRGSLELFAISATYRSHSLLCPAARPRLLAWPRRSLSDPLCLTNGSRGIDDALWISEDLPRLPLEFVWAFSATAQISLVQINQHPYWPSREVELVFVSEAGDERIAWSGTLSEGRPDTREPPYDVITFNGETAHALKLRILSGYHDQCCGLDGIEVYGTGIAFKSDGMSCTVSTEVSELKPGSSAYARLVLDDCGETLYGAVESVALPADRAPRLDWARPLVRARNPACVVVRGNAMGRETAVWAELELSSGARINGPVASLGMQENARHLYYNPIGVSSVPGTLRLYARNSEGDSVLIIPWPLTGQVNS